MMGEGQEFQPHNLTQAARSSGASAEESRRALLRDTATTSRAGGNVPDEVAELDRCITDLQSRASLDRNGRRLVKKLQAKRDELAEIQEWLPSAQSELADHEKWLAEFDSTEEW